MTRFRPREWRREFSVPLQALQGELNRLFEEYWDPERAAPAQAPTDLETPAWAPAVDLDETPHELVLRVDLPGVDPAGVDLSLTGTESDDPRREAHARDRRRDRPAPRATRPAASSVTSPSRSTSTSTESRLSASMACSRSACPSSRAPGHGRFRSGRTESEQKPNIAGPAARPGGTGRGAAFAPERPSRSARRAAKFRRQALAGTALYGKVAATLLFRDNPERSPHGDP